MFLNMQAKSPAGRDKIIDRIVHAEYQGPVCDSVCLIWS
jgi:hypothetical protein